MEPKISVVLPIYNVEKYLEKCMESIFNQTYKNLEIILVDDGSPDGCPALCDSFAQKDSRICVVHKQNGGISDARNAGIAAATGEYISFVDPDDYVENDYIEYLYSLIKKYDCKMSLCQHTVKFESGREICYGKDGDALLTSKECIERMLYNDVIDTSCWAKLFSADLAKKFLYPKGKLFEDIGTVYKFFIESGTIACGWQSKYFYMMRAKSIVHCSFNPHKLDLLEMTDSMAKDVLATFPDLEKAVLRRQVYSRFSTLNQMLDVKEKVYKEKCKEIIRYIRENKKALLSDKRLPRRDRLALYLLSMGFFFYKLAWKFFKAK